MSTKKLYGEATSSFTALVSLFHFIFLQSDLIAFALGDWHLSLHEELLSALVTHKVANSTPPEWRELWTTFRKILTISAAVFSSWSTTVINFCLLSAQVYKRIIYWRGFNSLGKVECLLGRAEFFHEFGKARATSFTMTQTKNLVKLVKMSQNYMRWYLRVLFW